MKKKPPQVLVRVTRAMIREADRKRGGEFPTMLHCPVAIGADAAIYNAPNRPCVSRTHLTIHGGERYAAIWRLPPSVRSFIRDWDSRRPVSPISFTLPWPKGTT